MDWEGVFEQELGHLCWTQVVAALGCHGAGFLMRDLSDMSKFRLSHWVQAHLSVIFYSILPIALTVRSTKYDFFKSSLVFSPGHPDMASVRPLHQPPGGTSCRFWHGSTFRVGTSPIACFLMLLWYNQAISSLRHCEEKNPADCRWGLPLAWAHFSYFSYSSFNISRWGLPLAWALSALPLTPILLGAVLQIAWIRRGVPFTMVGSWQQCV